jgi:hypothetical protein
MKKDLVTAVAAKPGLVQKLARHLVHMLSGKDNSTVDVARVSMLLLVLGFIGLAAADLYHGGKWDPQSYGIAAGALLAGGGAGIGMKAKTEPDATTDGGAS